jgi:Domain of unknown function (DUF6378)
VNIVETLNDRQARYGDFGKLAQAAQAFKSVCRHSPSWVTMTATQREAAEMIMLKMCRILYGDPLHFDTWHDVAGYALLAAEEFSAGKRPMTPAANPKAPVDLLLEDVVE